MKKIAVISPFLANGGAEKVAVITAQELSKTYDVIFVLFDSSKIDYRYDGPMIDLHAPLMSRNLIKRVFNLFKATLFLYRLKRKCHFDFVISHGELGNLPNILSGGKNNIVVIHENRFAAVKDFQGRFVNYIIKYIYTSKNVMKIITVSEGIRTAIIENLRLDAGKITTLYNPFDIYAIKEHSQEPIERYGSIFDHPTVMTMGRLTFAKGQWFLLRIFSALMKRKPDVKLIILGDGEMRQQLIDYSLALGLSTFDVWSDKEFNSAYDVFFLGFHSNPFNYMSKAQLFCMTSLWEGFGNTIVEAMACGTPVLSTDCQSGPVEIIRPAGQDQEIGILMSTFKSTLVDYDSPLDDVEKNWVETLDVLLDDQTRMENLSANGLRRAEDFDTAKIIQKWRQLLDSETKVGG